MAHLTGCEWTWSRRGVEVMKGVADADQDTKGGEEKWRGSWISGGSHDTGEPHGPRNHRQRTGGAIFPSFFVAGVAYLLSAALMADAFDPFESNIKAPFNASTINRFHPGESMSFAQVLFDGFDLKYADTADLRGFIGQDIVQLGHFFSRTKFGCITKCDSADFNGVDGILGLGMPDAALASIPEPLMFAITDNTGDPVSQRILKNRKFTLVVTKTAGEMQLGGHDEGSIAPGHDMQFIKTTSTAEYSVPITSMRFGDEELLDFATVINPRVPGRMAWIPGILDSGTSCIVMPDSNLHGVLRKKPFSTLVGLVGNPLFAKTRRLPITLTIGGHRFDIPFDEWWLEAENRPCIQSSPDAFMGVLLGDVFFRTLVVQFDLTHPTMPVIGLAPRNPHYKPVRPGSDWAKHKPHHGFDFGIPEGFDGSDATSSSAIDKIPLDTGLQIFVTIAVGTPRQHFKVILDTGSSVLGIFCDAPPKKGEPKFAHIYLPHFIPFSGPQKKGGGHAEHHPRRPGGGRGRAAHEGDTGS